MAQIISFEAARAARTIACSAPALHAVRQVATGRRSLTAAQNRRRDEVRAKARTSL